MLDIFYGNVSPELADRLGAASVKPVLSQIGDKAVVGHHPGDTEPWISRLVGDFVVANGSQTVLETGGFTGATSAYLLDALGRLGTKGTLVVCEIDDHRTIQIRKRLEEIPRPASVNFHVVLCDVLHFLADKSCPRFDLAFVDDNHEKQHVRKELTLLYPKINPGGLILLHDVFGSCDLQSVVHEFGGYSIDLPRLGLAGGLGIIQIPRQLGGRMYLQSPETQNIVETLKALGA